MAEFYAAMAYLAIWVLMAVYVSYHAYKRESKFWPAHFFGCLFLGFIYAAGYGLHVKYS